MPWYINVNTQMEENIHGITLSAQETTRLYEEFKAIYPTLMGSS